MISFASCDWGTSTFRLRLPPGVRPREIRNQSGVASLANRGGDRAQGFRDTLNQARSALSIPTEMPILISGMASSSLGWKELPYAELPFALDGSDAIWTDLGEHLYLISGARGATDMMRGEETQALGVAALLGKTLPPEALLILPGTHSKHLTLRNAQITEIRTFMTGELFDLLMRQSVLRHSTTPDATFDATSFQDGVTATRTHSLIAKLFRVRTRQVLDHKDAESNTSFLSGLLIGTELAELAENKHPLLVAATEPLLQAYRLAVQVLDLPTRVQFLDADQLTELGQAVLLPQILQASGGV
jgi:2-dehydro-3-deoxygalactonokinase